MALSQDIEIKEENTKTNLTTSKKRRLRRKKLRAARNSVIAIKIDAKTVPYENKKRSCASIVPKRNSENKHSKTSLNGIGHVCDKPDYFSKVEHFITNLENKMSSKPTKSREEVLAAREVKKLNKTKAKTNNESSRDSKKVVETERVVVSSSNKESPMQYTEKLDKTELNSPVKENITKLPLESSSKGKDEVDRAKFENKNVIANIGMESTLKSNIENESNVKDSNTKENKTEQFVCSNTKTNTDKTKEQVKAERAAKKAAKQVKKIGDNKESNENTKKSLNETIVTLKKENVEESNNKTEGNIGERIGDSILLVEKDLTVREVVETLKDIVNVAKEVQAVTDKVKSIDLGGKKSEESGKSKAELKAERRAKQEAQRAAKKNQQNLKPAEKEEGKKTENTRKPAAKTVKTMEKSKPKAQSLHRVNWFQHLYGEHDMESLKKIALNSNLHPAVIKLGVQLASQVVTGSNARCIALLDALKKMVRDYTLPAKTEFARGLEAHLATSLEFLWAMRQPSASQTNAIKHFRRQLTQLPNSVDEFDAKKTLQEEIDRYIREQIDMAGEAISLAVRNKISNGDNILTYGCSSLIERILKEAWADGARFNTVVVGDRVRRGAREMLRRLAASGLPCSYADITAVSFLMGDINKVILGACSLLVNGSVLGPLGSSQVALVARSHNVPVLVACETHKFSERVQTDAFVYNELGNPDDLIDKTDENSPLKDWRSNANLNLLNLTYDVTPPSLVTAVVTELAILPCTSAPVVVRTKQSEYGI